MSEALQRIPEIEFTAVEKTAYGRALNNRFADGTGLGTIIHAGFGMGALLGTITLGVSLFGFESFVAGLSSLGISMALGMLGMGIWGNRDLQRQIKETLASPLKRFEWILARAISSFNHRVRAYNHWIDGCEFGYADPEAEAPRKIQGLLLRSAELLSRGARIYNYVKDGASLASVSEAPELTAFLAELQVAEKDLRTYRNSLKAGSASAERVLDVEAAHLELEAEMQGLLPAGNVK